MAIDKFNGTDGMLTADEQMTIHNALSSTKEAEAAKEAITNDKNAFVADMKEYILDLKSFMTAGGTASLENDSLVKAYNDIRTKHPEFELPDLILHLNSAEGKTRSEEMKRAYQTPEAKEAINNTNEELRKLKPEVIAGGVTSNADAVAGSVKTANVINKPIEISPQVVSTVSDNPKATETGSVNTGNNQPKGAIVNNGDETIKQKNTSIAEVPQKTKEKTIIDQYCGKFEANGEPTMYTPNNKEELYNIVTNLKPGQVLILTYSGCPGCKAVEHYAQENNDKFPNALFVNCDNFKSDTNIKIGNDYENIVTAYPAIYMTTADNTQKEYKKIPKDDASYTEFNTRQRPFFGNNQYTA